MLKAWFSLRLHIQLALASCILLAITVSIITWLNIQSQQQTLIKNTTHEAVSLAKSISIISSYLVITNKLDELESLLIQTASFPIVSSVKVLSTDGHILSHVKKQDSGEIVIDFDLTTEIIPENEEAVKTRFDLKIARLLVWLPVRTSTLLGWVKLDVSLHEVVRLHDEMIIDNLIGAVIAILLDLLVLFAILFVPAKSFKKVVEFAKNMTNNPGSKMVIPGGSYEINILLDALNNSSQALALQNTKIQQQTDSLIQLNAHQALLEKEAEQLEVLNSMLESVITIDEKGTVFTFNKSAETLFGYSTNEVIGQNITMLMPPPYVHEHQAYIQRYINGGSARVIGIGREVEGKRKNTEIFPMRLSVSELPKDKGGTRRFIGSCQDITQIKQQEEQLRRTQKMDALGQLTGGIAHDYNNLLGIIFGYAELLHQKLSHDPKMESYASQILHAAERGATLTKKILGFSRHKIPETSVLNINNLLLKQQLMLEKTLSAKFRLVFDLSDELWMVNIDGGDFEDSIVNMAINAMEGGGQLIFHTENIHLNPEDGRILDLPTGDFVLLSIKDTGIGMSEETKSKIFDPFFTTKGEYGTGLGLSQVYGFIQRCDGGVKVDSSLEKGTLFTLYFPRSHQAAPEIQEPDAGVLSEHTTKETILVVDDEVALIEMEKAILTSSGFNVFTASDGFQALKILENETIDLLVTDVVMPNMDGYELAAQVQKRYPHIKIQIVTGFTEKNSSDIENQTLSKNRISKPFTIKIFLEKIHNLLEGSDHQK